MKLTLEQINNLQQFLNQNLGKITFSNFHNLLILKDFQLKSQKLIIKIQESLQPIRECYQIIIQEYIKKYPEFKDEITKFSTKNTIDNKPEFKNIIIELINDVRFKEVNKKWIEELSKPKNIKMDLDIESFIKDLELAKIESCHIIAINFLFEDYIVKNNLLVEFDEESNKDMNNDETQEI